AFRLVPRITRAKADAIVANMLARARVINADTNLLFQIDRIIAFGSFITDAEELGDIDLVVQVSPRIARYSGWVSNVVEPYLKKWGQRSDDWWWPERQVKHMLKGRNRYLQLASPDAVEELGAPTKLLFERESARPP